MHALCTYSPTYVLLGSGAFLSDTFSVVVAGLVKPAGLVGDGALNLLTDVGVGGFFCVNCFSLAFFSSSSAFLKKAMRSFTDPMPPFCPNLAP